MGFIRNVVSSLSLIFIASCLTLPPTTKAEATLQTQLFTTRISQSFDGSDVDGSSGSPAMSANGRFIAFASHASNLIPGDTNTISDIFVSDRQQGEISTASIAVDGTIGNGASYQPAISADGRFIAFASLASNFANDDANGMPDIYLRDQVKGSIERVSLDMDSSKSLAWNDHPSISGDGRYIAYLSHSVQILDRGTFRTSDVFLYDRITKTTNPVSFPGNLAAYPAISQDGRFLAYLSKQNSNQDIRIYDRITGMTKNANLGNKHPEVSDRFGPPVLSADGRFITFRLQSDNIRKIILSDQVDESIVEIPVQTDSDSTSWALGKLAISADGQSIVIPDTGMISVFERDTNTLTAEDVFPLKSLRSPTISGDGRYLAIAGAESSRYDIYSAQLNTGVATAAFVAGWVSDGLGHPVVGVAFSDNAGHTGITRSDGSFSLQGMPKGNYTLTPSMEGFAFSPTNRRIFASPDGTVGLAFIGVPDKIVEEAEKDIGMPYSVFRGCESLSEECNGPFHGYFSGDCTDLVMDSYWAGVDFDIQVALVRDFRLNPHHYYRWRDARNSHDMWRYFAYSGLILTHDEPYLLGDIVFFDWEIDGIVDHVAIVSELTSRGRPRKIIDATGVISDNPSGLAMELEWKPYHAAHTPGHTRWLGTARPRPNPTPPGYPILNVALDSPVVSLRISDTRGRFTSADQVQIPDSRYIYTGLGTVVSIARANDTSGWYFLEISTPVDSAYQLGIQIVDETGVRAFQTMTREIAAGEMQIIPLQIKTLTDVVTFDIPLEPP